MPGKFYNIDPETCTREELLAAIENCKTEEENYHTLEQSCKIFINSIYGAMANKFYYNSNIAMAESITLQGQDLIKYSVRVVNKYFKEMWPTDIAAHQKIAEYMLKWHKDFDVNSFMSYAQKGVSFGETLQINGDTDSAYISLQPIIKTCHIPLEFETDFVLAINEGVLSTYLEKAFDEYAAAYNCPKNLEKFELEKIARSVIMLAKKKYIMDISWKEPNVHVEPLHSVVYKGIEVIQGSTPDFCRDCMKEFIKFMLGKIAAGIKPEYIEIVNKLKELKTKFSMQNPNEISKSFAMSDYEKYVYNDKQVLQYNQNVTVPMHVRAAANYNYKLYNSAKRYKSKYKIVHKGDKVKFYYTTDPQPNDVFGFLPNEFPVEFAPKMDIDTQFEKMVLEPLNRIIEASGYPKVSAALTFSAGLW